MSSIWARSFGRSRLCKFRIHRCRRTYRSDRNSSSSSNNSGADAGRGFVPLLHRNKQAKVEVMGHNRGRDNVRKRAKRRKKSERLILAKQPSPRSREEEKKAAK
jgi:hypothetical protein